MASRRHLSASFDVKPLFADPDDDKYEHSTSLPQFNGIKASSPMGAVYMTARRRLRSKRLWFIVIASTIVYLVFYVAEHPASFDSVPHPHASIPPPQSSSPQEELKPQHLTAADGFQNLMPPVLEGAHPMLSLATNAQKEFEALQARQSKTLQEAVHEYRRRYGLPPPPNFDKWYEFARSRNVQLIDEYDTILDSLTPFWGVKPSVIRARARETQGYDNVMISMLIRHGNVTKIDGGRDWMLEAVLGMTAGFTQWLPDMDICINAHDEPRVILPHDDLARLVTRARNVTMRAAGANKNPENTFSSHPEMGDGTRIDEVLRTRFNSMQKQETWTHSRLSCPPDSPSRSLDEDVIDDMDSYAVQPLGFIKNSTAFGDICQSPSFASSFGFFTGANIFNVVHDLFPIFSQSKVSSYQDIIFPSPWYWYNKVPYDEKKDLQWREKEDVFWWRGSTTGGFSRRGGWRRQHRQHVVQMLNAADQTRILHNTAPESEAPHWEARSVFRPDYSPVFNVAFSEIGQCDPGDCKAQKQFFNVVKKAKPDEAWKYKFLLDMDGNAFSGRFYAFLKSRSLVFKMAVFREWHSEILKPWVHYVPLSLNGGEWLESVRWLFGERDGKLAGEKMARQSKEWAEKVLRNEDMEAWLFRLLLEYGRVIDDNRESIGYAFPFM